MKLYLSSEMLPHPERVQQLMGSRVAPEIIVIRNAFDPYTVEQKTRFYQTVATSLEPLGGRQRVVDLREYADRSQELKTTLQNAHLIWCTGGNTFWLRYLMRKSGFDQIIRPILDTGAVYGGFSAGALVAGPTLENVDLIDDPTVAPQVIWDGLNLTDTIVWPHWEKEKYQPVQSEIERRLVESSHPIVRLKDGEAYLIADEECKKLSSTP